MGKLRKGILWKYKRQKGGVYKEGGGILRKNEFFK